jgi:hypothetical protein
LIELETEKRRRPTDSQDWNHTPNNIWIEWEINNWNPLKRNLSSWCWKHSHNEFSHISVLCR